MNLASVKPGDIILANVKGRIFHAQVLSRDGRELHVLPITANITYRHVKSREVKGLWLKSRQGSRLQKEVTHD